jgi:hypothetical protein
MNSLLILIPVVLVGYSIYKQMTPRPVQSLESELKRPLIFVGIGIVTATTWLLTGSTEVFVVSLALAALSAVAGALRGATIPLTVTGGQVIRKGNATTLALWLGMIAVKVVVALAILQRAPTAGEILFFVGVSLGTQAAVTSRRATALTTRPVPGLYPVG